MDTPWWFEQVIDSSGHIWVDTWVKVGQDKCLDWQVLISDLALALVLIVVLLEHSVEDLGGSVAVVVLQFVAVFHVSPEIAQLRS